MSLKYPDFFWRHILYHSMFQSVLTICSAVQCSVHDRDFFGISELSSHAAYPIIAQQKRRRRSRGVPIPRAATSVTTMTIASRLRNCAILTLRAAWFILPNVITTARPALCNRWWSNSTWCLNENKNNKADQERTKNKKKRSEQKNEEQNNQTRRKKERRRKKHEPSSCEHKCLLLVRNKWTEKIKQSSKLLICTHGEKIELRENRHNKKSERAIGKWKITNSDAQRGREETNIAFFHTHFEQLRDFLFYIQAD